MASSHSSGAHSTIPRASRALAKPQARLGSQSVGKTRDGYRRTAKTPPPSIVLGRRSTLPSKIGWQNPDHAWQAPWRSNRCQLPPVPPATASDRQSPNTASLHPYPPTHASCRVDTYANPGRFADTRPRSSPRPKHPAPSDKRHPSPPQPPPAKADHCHAGPATSAPGLNLQAPSSPPINTAPDMTKVSQAQAIYALGLKLC